MPKLKNVTPLELAEFFEANEEALFIAFDINDRMQKGYCDTLPDAIDMAKSASAIAETFSKMTKQLLVRTKLQEQLAQLSNLKEQVAKQETS